MNKIQFNAHSGDHIGSMIIKAFSRGKYSHISILFGGYVYEAVAKKGVIKTRAENWDSSTVIDSMFIRTSDENYMKVLDFLEKQIGKKYDYRGIFSFLFQFLRPKMGAWYCSELAKVVLYKGIGVASTADEYDQTVSPKTFWRDLTAIKQVQLS